MAGRSGTSRGFGGSAWPCRRQRKCVDVVREIGAFRSRSDLEELRRQTCAPGRADRAGASAEPFGRQGRSPLKARESPEIGELELSGECFELGVAEARRSDSPARYSKALLLGRSRGEARRRRRA